jgi:flagellar biogenesis protein FliO
MVVLKNLRLTSLLFCLSFAASAVEVTSVKNILKKDDAFYLDINFQGRIVSPPHFVVDNNKIAIKWPEAVLSKKFLSKDLEAKSQDGALLLIFKQSKSSQKDLYRLSLKLGSGNVTANIPVAFLEQKVAPVAPAPIPSAPVVAIKKEHIKEDYLSYLLSSVDKESKKNEIVKELPKAVDNIKAVSLNSNNLEEKQLKTSETVPFEKIKTSTPVTDMPKSFSSYVVKIILVLSFIVFAILLLAKASKKIIAGKNKLSFLNNSKVVEILNTTFIGPKRQLLLVKVHDQVLLLSNSENGISFLSEVNDLSQILKSAEKEISGSNFDSDMSKSPETNNITLKDNQKIFESTPVDIKTSKMRTVLKNKAKSLKAWQ